MTTIAYRAGIIAADTQTSMGNTFDVCSTKIAQRGPFLAGCSGTSTICQRFLDWFRTGLHGELPQMHDHTDEHYTAWGIVITPDHRILTFNQSGTHHSRMRAEFYAIGSGSDVAVGAMHMGATAEEAIRAAMRWDMSTGGDVMLLRRPATP